MTFIKYMYPKDIPYCNGTIKVFRKEVGSKSSVRLFENMSF